jgi:orotate phosphoribosyltransferase
MPNLIPSTDAVMGLLKKTGAYRHGHFVYPNGKHAANYFQMPLAFRNYDTAKILGVGLSRLFRVEKSISSLLPNVAVVSPGPGGILVAVGVREALGAKQIYWAEIEEGKRLFRQYVNKGDVMPAIIVDDLIRSGKALYEAVGLIEELGGKVIGCGAIVRFKNSPTEIGGVPIKSLVEFDARLYDTWEECRDAEGADLERNVAAERVRM